MKSKNNELLTAMHHSICGDGLEKSVITLLGPAIVIIVTGFACMLFNNGFCDDATCFEINVNGKVTIGGPDPESKDSLKGTELVPVTESNAKDEVDSDDECANNVAHRSSSSNSNKKSDDGPKDLEVKGESEFKAHYLD